MDQHLQEARMAFEERVRCSSAGRNHECPDLSDRWKRAGSMAVPCSHHRDGPVRSATREYIDFINLLVRIFLSLEFVHRF